jgi:hypothetical protein
MSPAMITKPFSPLRTPLTTSFTPRLTFLALEATERMDEKMVNMEGTDVEVETDVQRKRSRQIKTVMNHNMKIGMRTFLDSLQKLLVEFLFGKRVGNRSNVQNSGLFLVIGSCRLLDLLFLLFLAHVYNVLKGLLNRIAAGSSRKKKKRLGLHL